MTSLGDPSPRDALIAERRQTVELIDSLSARLAAVVAATADETNDDEHDPEGATLAVERGHLVSLLARSRVRLDEIDAAIERFGHGSYGRCETCGGPISAERLDALPAARQCIDCAMHRPTKRW